MLGRGIATGFEGHSVRDRVCHYRDAQLTGVIVAIDDNRLTCTVQWDDCEEGNTDVQWSNKLIRIA